MASISSGRSGAASNAMPIVWGGEDGGGEREEFGGEDGWGGGRKVKGDGRRFRVYGWKISSVRSIFGSSTKYVLP